MNKGRTTPRREKPTVAERIDEATIRCCDLMNEDVTSVDAVNFANAINALTQAKMRTVSPPLFDPHGEPKNKE